MNENMVFFSMLYIFAWEDCKRGISFWVTHEM